MAQGTLPKTLPAKPTGWTKQFVMHLNFGSKGGAATYKIKDARGNEMPIGYQYDTRKEGLTGFTLPNIEQPMTWQELRKCWPDYLRSVKS